MHKVIASGTSAYADEFPRLRRISRGRKVNGRGFYQIGSGRAGERSTMHRAAAAGLELHPRARRRGGGAEQLQLGAELPARGQEGPEEPPVGSPSSLHAART